MLTLGMSRHYADHFMCSSVFIGTLSNKYYENTIFPEVTLANICSDFQSTIAPLVSASLYDPSMQIRERLSISVRVPAKKEDRGKVEMDRIE